MQQIGPDALSESDPTRIKGFHGFSCPKCAGPVGFTRSCKQCGTAVTEAEVVVEASSPGATPLVHHSAASLAVSAEISRVDPKPGDPSPFSDSEGDTTLNHPAPLDTPVEESSYRMSNSKPSSLTKQKLASGGYGYHQTSPYTPIHSTPPPAKRQAVPRRPTPRRPLPKIPSEGGSTLLTPFGGIPRKGIREHTVSLRLEHIQKVLRPVLLKFMQHTSNRNIFNEPVSQEIPHYYERVSLPPAYCPRAL